MRTDGRGQTDTAKLIVAFDNFANAPKNIHDYKNAHKRYYWEIHIKYMQSRNYFNVPKHTVRHEVKHACFE